MFKIMPASTISVFTQIESAGMTLLIFIKLYLASELVLQLFINRLIMHKKLRQNCNRTVNNEHKGAKESRVQRMG